MIRLFAILVIFCQLLCFPVFAGSNNVLLAHREPAVTGTLPIGNLVVAKKRILSKATVLADDVQLMQADAIKIPDDAYKKVSSVVGKIARYDIEPGTILSTVHLQQASVSKHLLQIDLDPLIYAKLQTMAKKLKLSEAAMARKLLEQHLKKISSDSK